MNYIVKPRKFLPLAILIFWTNVGCEKKGEQKFIAKPGTDLHSKPIDSIYANLPDLVKDVKAVTDLKHFFEGRTWKTEYDRTYSVVLPSDTVFTRERFSGFRWWFFFFSFPSVPPFEGSITQEISTGDIGVPFKLSGNTMILNFTNEYKIMAPTRYNDSTFSILLEKTTVTDSIKRVDIIKLQSTP